MYVGSRIPGRAVRLRLPLFMEGEPRLSQDSQRMFSFAGEEVVGRSHHLVALCLWLVLAEFKIFHTVQI